MIVVTGLGWGKALDHIWDPAFIAVPCRTAVYFMFGGLKKGNLGRAADHFGVRVGNLVYVLPSLKQADLVEEDKPTGNR